MSSEVRLRLKQRSYLLKSGFSLNSYISLLSDISQTDGNWDLLPDPKDILPEKLRLDAASLAILCDLIRYGRSTSAAASSPAPDNPRQVAERASVSDEELGSANQIIESVENLVSACDDCRKDKRLWPFVDAFVLDLELRKLFDGKNPFEHFSEVIRSYFADPSRPAPKKFPELFWMSMLGILSAWEVKSAVEACDRNLLIQTLQSITGAGALGTEATLYFLGASTGAANVYLAHVPEPGDPSRRADLATLRLFLLLFDIGDTGASLVEPLKKGESDTVTSRISRLLGGSKNLAPPFPDALAEVLGEIGYTPKVIEVDHIVSLMPYPDDGDDAGVEFYVHVSKRLGALIEGLSSEWPGTVESLNQFIYALELQSDYAIDLKQTVAIEAARMSAGWSDAGLQALDNNQRTTQGLKLASLLRRDAWHGAADDFVGFLLLLYSFFPERITKEERRQFSEYFNQFSSSIRSPLILRALEILAGDDRYEINRLWAGQYTVRRHAQHIQLVRPREDYASGYEIERALASDLGGDHMWLRLQPRTRELLIKAELRWNNECRRLGRDGEWGSLAGDFFLPVEHDLKHWFGFLANDPVRSECIAGGVKIPESHLTAGPIINAMKKLPKLSSVVADAVRERGINATALPELMKRMYEVLDIRNQGYHGAVVTGGKLIAIRDAMFSKGLLRMYAECLPGESNP